MMRNLGAAVDLLKSKEELRQLIEDLIKAQKETAHATDELNKTLRAIERRLK